MDRVFELEEFPRTAQKIDALHARESGGGPASTAAVAIAQLGGHASFVGHLGNDSTGQALLKKLADKNIDIDHVISVDGFKTIAPIVLVDRNGERCIIVHRQKAVIDEDAIKFDFSDVGLLLTDTRWIEGAQRAVHHAVQKNIPILIDADGGKKQEILTLVRSAQHVIFSDQGLYDCTSDGSLESRLNEIAKICSGIIAVTHGATGSSWLMNGIITPVPAFNVVAKDTTGCGDVFHGAYALAIIQGLSPLVAARFASAAAALKAKNGNGWDGMPNRQDVEGLLASSLSMTSTIS